MSAALLTLVVLFLLAYSWQLQLIRRRWLEIKSWEIPSNFTPSKKISVLIPVRNEAHGIEACLNALQLQTLAPTYFDIHVIDDHSSDFTLKIASEFGLENLHLHQLPEGESGKKAALAYGAKVSKGDLIITTDGDCIADPDWLSSTLSYYQENLPVMICGAVVLEPATTRFKAFQALDFSGMMGVSAVGVNSRQIRLCNGANLAFDRKSFYEVGTYEGINQIPSGDDVLLLDKMEKRFPGRVAFLKQPTGLVRSRPLGDWKSFFEQRLRWAAKTNKNPHWPTLILSALVFGTCLSIALSLIFISVWGIFPFLIFFFWKMLIDYLFLSTMATYYDQSKLLPAFFPAQIYHLIYWILIGFASLLFQKITWKGRTIRLK